MEENQCLTLCKMGIFTQLINMIKRTISLKNLCLIIWCLANAAGDQNIEVSYELKKLKSVSEVKKAILNYTQVHSHNL